VGKKTDFQTDKYQVLIQGKGGKDKKDENAPKNEGCRPGWKKINGKVGSNSSKKSGKPKYQRKK